MKLHKFRFVAFFFILLAIATFTSCDDDDDYRGYWINAFVDFDITPVTYNDGFFEQSAWIHDGFFRDKNDRIIDYRAIENFRINDNVYETFIRISNRKEYGYIDWFEIIVDGSPIYSYDPKNPKNPKKKIELAGKDFHTDIIDDESLDVTFNILDRIILNGETKVTIRGQTNLQNVAEPINFKFFNNVQFFVR